MPYPFHGPQALSYTQYLDVDTGRMLITDPGGTYDMQPVPGAGNVPVPPGDGLWGEPETPLADEPKTQPPAEISAPPGAPDQPARKNGNGKETTAADAALEGSE